MAKLENRFIRIEDWKGNVYYPLTNVDMSMAGTISGDASNAAGSDPYTDADPAYVGDPQANKGKAICLASHISIDKVLYRGTFINIPLGDVTIGPRLKISSIENPRTDDIVMKCYFRDMQNLTDYQLESFNIGTKEFGSENTYYTIPRMIAYKVPSQITEKVPYSLLVELIVKAGANKTFWFDQMYVAPSIGWETQTNVSVNGRKIIIAR